MALQPDLVFLDVQMPGADGFDVIDAVGADKMPFVVFVTAYDRYALRAFDVHALDYLLKPFDRERFREALDPRPGADRTQRTGGDIERRLAAIVQDLKPAKARTDRFVVKSGGRIFFVRTARDRLDRGGRQLRQAARRQRLAPDPRDDERGRGASSRPTCSSASTAATSSTSSRCASCSRGSTASTWCS